MLTRKSFITRVLAAVPVMLLGVRAGDAAAPATTIKATDVVPPTVLPTDHLTGHGPTSPSKKGWGPMKIETYVNMEYRPEVHGYTTIEFTKADRSVDVFKVRQRIDVSERIPMPGDEPAEHVVTDKDVANKAITIRELDPKGVKPPKQYIQRLVYTDIKRVLNTGVEVSVRDFDVTIDLGTVMGIEMSSKVMDDALLPAADRIVLTWVEQTYMR